MKEKRGTPRFHIDQMIEFSLDGEVHFHAKLANISENGVQVNTEIEPEAQAPVDLVLGFETDDDRVEIPLEGIIIRVKPHGKNFTAGIQFMDVRPEQKKMLHDFIKRCK